MLEETLDRALQNTLYWHRVDVLRNEVLGFEDAVRKMFAAQAYDVLYAVFMADLGEAERDDDDREVALIMAAIAAALAARVDRDVQILYPSFVSTLTTSLVQSGLAKYGVYTTLDSIQAQDWILAHGAELVAGINETTREAMARLLADALARGDSVDDIASLLMQNFDDMVSCRAKGIAITETSKAWSFAEMSSAELMEKAGYKMVKEWLLGPMHPRYDPCDHNHEEGAIPLHRPFSTGDMAPPQHPNCGCSLVTYPAGGDQPWGSQVMGQTPLMPFGFDRGEDNA